MEATLRDSPRRNRRLADKYPIRIGARQRAMDGDRKLRAGEVRAGRARPGTAPELTKRRTSFSLGIDRGGMNAEAWDGGGARVLWTVSFDRTTSGASGRLY